MCLFWIVLLLYAPEILAIILPLTLIVTCSVMEAHRLWWATGRRLGFESLVIVPLEAERVDDVQAEGRGALDGVANHFRFGADFRLVAGAVVVAAVEELGVDVVHVAVVDALTVFFTNRATFGHVLGFLLGFLLGLFLGFFFHN